MFVSQVLDDLRAAAPLVAPSLLSCDFTQLGQEVRKVEQAGARILHLDVMDGHFVPNISFGFPIVRAVRGLTELPLDVHLMISEPERYVERFREAGADLITFHIEAVPEPRDLLERVRDLGAAAGLSLNPPTPLERIEPFLSWCDVVLVMSVMPGFGGQEFEPEALTKLRRLRELRGGELLLSVDGGVNRQTVPACADAGADILVTGSALFGEDDYARYIEDVNGLAKASRDAQV